MLHFSNLLSRMLVVVAVNLGLLEMYTTSWGISGILSSRRQGYIRSEVILSSLFAKSQTICCCSCL
jgi:hypothetical protein